MKKTFALFLACALPAQAQITAYITNAIDWVQPPSAISAVAYDVMITTNKTFITTRGYNPPATAVLSEQTVNTNKIALTNLWPGITNGVYSVFVQGVSATGVLSPTSTNIIIQIQIPPVAPENLRVIAQ